MGTLVTDPNLLAKLRGASAPNGASLADTPGAPGKLVTDPDLLAKLNGVPDSGPSIGPDFGLQPANRTPTAVPTPAPPTQTEPAPDSGPWANIAAGLNDALYHVVGAPADLANTALRGAAASIHAKGGPDIQLPVDPLLGHQWIADLFSKVVGTTDPNKVVASDPISQMARFGANAGALAVAPEMALGTLAKAVPAFEGIAAAAKSLIGMGDTPGAIAKNVYSNAAAGVVGKAAELAAPDNLKPLAGAAGAVLGGGFGALTSELPSVAGAAARTARDYAAPMTTSGQEQLAANKFVSAADSTPSALKEALNNPAPGLPGVQPTTAQPVSRYMTDAATKAAAAGEEPGATGDYGLFSLERTLANKNATPFTQRAAENSAQLASSIKSLQDTGAPETVADAMKMHLANVAADEETAHAAQTTLAAQQAAAEQAKAAGAASALAPQADTAAIGDSMRQALEAKRAEAKTNERALWNAVDPTNSMTVGLHNTLAAQRLLANSITPLTAPITGTEANIHAALTGLDSPMQPLNSVADLSKQITSAMRQERNTAGESPTWARLSQMKGAVEQDLKDAVVGKVNAEQQAVQSGAIHESNTTLARMKAWEDAYYGGQQSNVVGTNGLGGNTGAGPAAVSGLRGTAGPGDSGPAHLAGDTGVPQGAAGPPADTAAVARLKSAQQATLQRKNTFDNSTLSPIRARPSSANDYNMASGDVPKQVFFQGPASPEAMQQYRSAVGDEVAIPQLHQAAATKLRAAALRDDGTLDPGKAATFVRSHQDALRALPGFDTKLIDAVRASKNADLAAKAAAAKLNPAAAAEAAKGAVGQLAALTDPADVSRTVGKIFNRADSMAQMQKVKAAIGNNPVAQEGLKKAIANHLADRLLGNTEAGLTGEQAIQKAATQNFVTKNAGALRVAGFDATQLNTLRRIVDSVQDAQRSIEAVKLPGGPNTARDIHAADAFDSHGTLTSKLLASAAIGTGDLAIGALAGSAAGWSAGVGSAVLATVVNHLREQGITKSNQMLERMMLDPAFARQLLSKVKLTTPRPRTPSRIGQRFARSSVAGAVATPPYR